MNHLEYSILSKEFILLLLIGVLPVTCLAQKDLQIDSLVNILQTHKEDSNKVKALNALSRQYWEKGKYQEANKYAHEALAISQIIKSKVGEANAYINIGLIYLYEGNYPEAMKNFLDALQLCKVAGSKEGIFDSYFGIAGVYWNQGNYSGALQNLFLNLKLVNEIRDKYREAKCFNGIGIIYQEQGNYSESMKYHIMSLKIKEQLGDKRGISITYGHLGFIYGALGNHSQALKNYFKSLKLKEELGDRIGISDAYLNIGTVYEKEGNNADALKNYFTCLKIKEELGDKKGIALSFTNIGGIYEKQKNYPLALKYHLSALELGEKIGYNKGIARSYNKIGELYIVLKKYAEAKHFLNEGLLLSKKIGAKEDIKNSYAGLARLDSATGNWGDAYSNYKNFILYRDSLQNEDVIKKMLHSQMQYEFNKKEDSLKYVQDITNEKLIQQSLLTQQHQQSILMKEKEYSLIMNEKKLQQLALEKNQVDFAMQRSEVEKNQKEMLILNKEKAIQSLQIKKQKLFQNYLFLVLILFSVLSFFIYKNYHARQKLKLQALRNKIASDLHDDVGSTLSSISIFSQIVQQETKEVIPLLETIGESSRKMLDAMGDIVWTINPENDQFEKIILRMRSFAYEMLGAKKIDFEFIAGEDVAKMKLLMDVRKNLYLIFKEAVNNMIKYSEADKALFSITASKNNLTMVIQDNGKGFNITDSSGGNGLKNMKRRAEEISGQLIISSFPGKGTTIELNVAV